MATAGRVSTRPVAATRRPPPPVIVALVPVGLVAILLSHLIDDVLAGAAVIVLWLIWVLLYEQHRLPVLPMAMSFQWTQVTCGLFYCGLTGRELEAVYASDYRPMVAIGLVCVVMITIGLAAGSRFASGREPEEGPERRYVLSWRALMVVYIGATLLSSGFRSIAWSIPGLTQGLLAIGYARFGVLLLLFRRLTHPRMRWGWCGGLLGFELAIGMTGYFAGFREPLILATLALLETSDWRAPAHWLRLGSLVSAMLVLGVLWMGIRGTYRAELDDGRLTSSRTERLDRVGALSSEWFGANIDRMTEDLDRLVGRMWVIYYPALAVSRVPSVLPHTDGRIMLDALKHLVTPRILFPGKGALLSDSEMVRTYSGVYVAGAEQNTTIAFGYAAESYVDFGIPLMFLPAFLFGVFMGVAYRLTFRVLQTEELATGFITVVFWLSLYLFERSWVRTLGLSITLLVYLGPLTLVLDRIVLSKIRARRRRAANATTHRRPAVS